MRIGSLLWDSFDFYRSLLTHLSYLSLVSAAVLRMHTYVPTDKHTYTPTYMNTYIYIHMHALQRALTCMCECMHTCIHMCSLTESADMYV